MRKCRKGLAVILGIALVALVMTLGLAATAWASEVAPTDSFEKELSITKMVEKTGDVTPPAEIFTFVLEDAAEEKHDLAYYGIQLLDDLKISTAAGTGTFEKTFKFKLPASDFERYHWTPGTNVGSNEIARYYKSFLLTEQKDGKAGWQYSTKEYAVTFTYRTEDQTMNLEIHTPGNDDYSRSAEFKNTYKITFTPDAITTGNYALAASEVLTITGAKITQATPTYTVPTGLTAKYGQTLADVNIAAIMTTEPLTKSTFCCGSRSCESSEAGQSREKHGGHRAFLCFER